MKKSFWLIFLVLVAVPAFGQNITGTGVQYGLPYWLTTSSQGYLAPPAVNGLYFSIYNVNSSLAVAPTVVSSANFPAGSVFGTTDVGTPNIAFGPNSITLSAGSGPPGWGGTPGSCALSPSSKGMSCLSSTGNRPTYSYNGGTATNYVLASDFPLNQDTTGNAHTATNAVGLSAPSQTGAPTFVASANLWTSNVPVTLPSVNFSGAAPAVQTSVEGGCPSPPASGSDGLCIGDSTGHGIEGSYNGDAYSPFLRQSGVSYGLLNTAGVISVDPLAANVVAINEEFVGGTNGDGSIGMLGWRLRAVNSGSVSSGSAGVGTWPNIGMYRLATDTTATHGATLALDSAGTSAGTLGALGSNAGWDSVFVFKLEQTTLTRFRIGYGNNGTCNTSQLTDVLANCGLIGLRFDTNTPAAVNIASNGITRTGSLVTVTTSGVHSMVLVGQSVTVAGATGCTTNPNGTWVVLSIPSTTTYNFSQSGTPETCGGASATSTPVTETNFKVELANQSSGVSSAGVWDTGIAADTLWHRLRIRSTVAGTILFTLYDASGGVQMSELSESNDVPTTTLGPIVQVVLDTGGSATKYADIDKWAFIATGLAR